MTDAPLLAGVELGGTKCIAVVARGTEILREHRLPTTDPASTLTGLSEALAEWQAELPFTALGIGTFGPTRVSPDAPDYGQILPTPKPGWTGARVLDHFADRFAVPMAFDTDVGAAALAEGRWGRARGCSTHAYVTVGTGIGIGIVANGQVLHGALHPEAGHLRVRRRRDDAFAGVCPFHGDCLEGLASGPAIAARIGGDATHIADDHPVWSDVGAELGELMATLILTVSPECIVIGGGVGGGRPALLDRIRDATAGALAGYVPGADRAALETLIGPPGLEARAGPMGALALALSALD
jgi:fructokinase